MKIETPDPTRIVDEQCPEPLRELVRSARRSGPSDAATQRVSKRLVTAGVLPAPATEPTAGAQAARKLPLHTLGFVALAVVGALVVSWRATEVPPAPEATGGAAPTIAAPIDPTRETPSDGESARGLRLEDERPATPAISVDDLPSVARRAPAPSASALTGSVVRTNAMPAAESPPSRDAATELELVQRAQGALAPDPERALAITGEHARAYPSGELVQEREVIAVEALARLGRKEDALRRARALVERFPRTPYAARLELAIGRPLTPTPARSPAASVR